MNTQIVDTNIILRLILNDQPSLHDQASHYFQQAAQQKLSLMILPIVIAEVVYVLENHYQRPRDNISHTLKVLLAQPYLQIPDRSTLISLWTYYLQGLHFTDSYLLAYTQQHHYQLLTFDQQLGSLTTSKTF